MFEATPIAHGQRTNVECAIAKLAIVLTVAFLLSSSAEAQLDGGIQGANANQNMMQIASWWGGPVRDVSVENGLAVTAIGTRLVTLDVSDPAEPQRLAEIDFEYVVAHVELRDGYAYIVTKDTPSAGNMRQFSVVDVRDPAQPDVVYASPPRGQNGGWSSNSGYQYQNIVLYGPFALLLQNSDRIDVYNVAIPENASFVQQCIWSDTIHASDLLVHGHLLIMLDDQFGDTNYVNIYDLGEDVFEPPLVSSTPVDGRLLAVAVEDDLLAALDDDNDRVLVFDISDPAAPVHSGSVEDLSRIGDVAIADGFLSVVDLIDGLSVYDVVSDFGVPQFVGAYNTHGGMREIVVADSIAYTLESAEGLVLIDVADAANPTRIGSYYSPACLRQMDKTGNHLYVTDEWHGFSIVDVADSADPVTVGVFEAPGDSSTDHFGIAVADHWALFAAGRDGVYVVDVADPIVPTTAFHFGIGNQWVIGAIEVHDEIVRVGWAGRLTNLDFANPPGLVHLGTANLGYDAAMAIETGDDDIVQIANRTHTVVDVSDPAQPVRLISDLGVRAYDLALLDHYTLITHPWDADDGGGFYVRDVGGDPSTPETVWYFPIDQARAVARSGDDVFFSAQGGFGNGFPYSCLFRFDAGDPENPTLVSYLRVEGIGALSELGFLREGSLDLLAENGVVYATTSEGLAIIQVGGARPPKAAVSILGR